MAGVVLLAVAAYGAGAPLLRGETREVGALFRDQEQEHADGLAQAIRDLGGTPNRPKPAREYAPMFGDLRNQEDVLRFAVDLENTAVAAYIDALPKLTSPELRATAAAIVTNEAEHLSVLLGALGEPQVPDAFVTGEAA
jgi:rubrerythrin